MKEKQTLSEVTEEVKVEKVATNPTERNPLQSSAETKGFSFLQNINKISKKPTVSGTKATNAKSSLSSSTSEFIPFSPPSPAIAKPAINLIELERLRKKERRKSKEK